MGGHREDEFASSSVQFHRDCIQHLATHNAYRSGRPGVVEETAGSYPVFTGHTGQCRTGRIQVEALFFFLRSFYPSKMASVPSYLLFFGSPQLSPNFPPIFFASIIFCLDLLRWQER